MPVLHDPDSTLAHWPARTRIWGCRNCGCGWFFRDKRVVKQKQKHKCFFAANLEDQPAGSPVFPL